jgi:hypothetical protein
MGTTGMPSLTGMTSWHAGLRCMQADDPGAFPGKFEVVLRFDDLAVVKAWCAWIIMTNDAAWQGAEIARERDG